MDAADSLMRMLAVLACSPLVTFLSHLAVVRALRGAARQLAAILGILLSYPPMTLLLAASFTSREAAHGPWDIALYALLVHSACAYVYFHFFNMSETARRIRLIIELYRRGGLTAGEIEALYRTSDVIHLRLERLVQLGQLEYDGGSYQLKGRMLYFAARVVAAWRKVLALESR